MFSLIKYSQAPILVEIPNLIRQIPNLLRLLPNLQIELPNLNDLHVWNLNWDNAMQALRRTLQNYVWVSPRLGINMQNEKILFARGLWGNHKRKVMVSFGVLGGGYFIYKIYEGHRSKIANDDLANFDSKKAVEEAIRVQLLKHYENTQKISDAFTLPTAMHFLEERISDKLDLSYYMQKLMETKKNKAKHNDLSGKERFETWDLIKVRSFTRATTALWTMTLLTLYSGVQVNILGRHLYLEMARSDASHSLGEADSLSKIEREQYLATATYLSVYGINSLIMNMQNAASEVLKQKKVNSRFSMEMLHEIITQILDEFMGVGDEPGLYNWIDYLLPENATQYRQLIAMSTSSFDDSSSHLSADVTKLEQLISETREVLSSEDFKTIVDISLRKGVEMLIEEIKSALESADMGDVNPLAKLLPRVAQLSVPVLEDPLKNNKFIHAIRSAPEVQLFYTFIYANIPRD